MDKKLDTLYDLCEVVSKALETANNKISRDGDHLDPGDVEYLDKLTHTMKSIKETISMLENEMMDDSSSGYYRYNDRRSTARGGRSGMRMGRYTRDMGYSRGDSREDFMDEIEELMDKAPDEHTRKKFEKLLNEMK